MIKIELKDFDSYLSICKYIAKHFEEDSIWNSGPALVEQFIYSNGTETHSPSLEFSVDESGPKITYICNQLFDGFGAFVGAIVGKSIISSQIRLSIQRVGLCIAKHYWSLGYRGVFDIDYVISKNGQYYPIETNARKTGGTHIFELTRKLFGPNWEKKIVAISSDTFIYGKKVIPIKTIQKKISKIAYPIAGGKTGVVITISDPDKPVLGYVIFAHNQNTALAIYNRLTCLLRNDIVMPI